MDAPDATAQQKAEIRGITEQAIADGLSSLELAQLRRKFSDTFQLPLRVVGSISAYVHYSATLAIQHHQLQSHLSNDDLVRMSKLLRDSPTRSRDAALLIAHKNISETELFAVIDTYEAYLSRRPGGLSRASSLLTPLPEGKDPQDCTNVKMATRPESIVSGSIESASVSKATAARGDLVDYDFRTKSEWRFRWANYIEQTLSATALRDAKVVCLPGRKVEPEVSHYLRLGIRPENIYAVESSRAVRDEFVQNAQRLGIQHFTRRLDEVSVAESLCLTGGPFSTWCDSPTLRVWPALA
jgi:hypothetical protein